MWPVKRLNRVVVVSMLTLFAMSVGAVTAPATFVNSLTSNALKVSYSTSTAINVNIAQNAIGYRANPVKGKQDIKFAMPDTVNLHLGAGGGGRQQVYPINGVTEYDEVSGVVKVHGTGPYGSADNAVFETDINTKTGQIDTTTTYVKDGDFAKDVGAYTVPASMIHVYYAPVPPTTPGN